MPRVPTVTPDAPAVLVQLSDSHLFAEADATLVGMNTRESLQRVIGLVREQQPRIDLLLATGDLSQDGTLASYQHFREMTAPFGVPARWIPGNHDEPQIMAHAALHSDLLEPVVDIEVLAPENAVGDLSGDLSGKRGQVTGTQPRISCTRKMSMPYASPARLKVRYCRFSSKTSRRGLRVAPKGARSVVFVSMMRLTTPRCY